MKIIKQSYRSEAQVSLVLLDWSVRESFHLLHYLSKQTVDRSQFEVILVEYYSRVSEAVKKFEDQVDTWILLEMPDECYYHKHLMYNVGIAIAKGEVICICDSDAMVKATFIESIINAFGRNQNIVFHIDQFRNMRRDFYPFNYPSFEEVLGSGCINNVNGKTSGICDQEDPIHTRNYGAGMCARCEDLIAIGGADEHPDYLGHICGPYDMTFRLVNKGLTEIWSEDEFTYHTWHPGQAGEDNYMGPHDGRHMSTTALQALVCGRVMPLVENPSIRQLRYQNDHDDSTIAELLIPSTKKKQWLRNRMESLQHQIAPTDSKHCVAFYRGVRIYQVGNKFSAEWMWLTNGDSIDGKTHASLAKVRKAIDRMLPLSDKLRLQTVLLIGWFFRVLAFLRRRLKSEPRIHTNTHE